jgi:hypothetical protein
MLSKTAVAITLAFFCLAAPEHGAADPIATCKEKKAKATGKKAADLLKAFGKNEKKPNAAKLRADISKAQSRFTKGFTKAEAKGCPTSGDAGTIEAKVDALVEDLLYQWQRFVDNGDGTMTDKVTGLMWEKKDDAGGLHDVDNKYPWAGCCDGNCSFPYEDSYCQPNAAAAAACSTQTGDTVGCAECTSGTCRVDPDGNGAITTIWDWLAVDMNQPPGFAGYTDWRIPEVSRFGGEEELDSLIDLRESYVKIFRSFQVPCTPGCTVSDCSCTAARYSYWSSTPHDQDPTNACLVHFLYVTVATKYKTFSQPVRAVRGGS